MKIHNANILSGIITITIFTAVIFPLYIIFYVEPAFTQFIISNTEKDAAQLGKHISGSFFKDLRPINKSLVTYDAIQEFQRIRDEFNIVKIKLFNSQGEIIYSTDSRDIGIVNTHEYFNSIVSKGGMFTKFVQKNKSSLEGKIMSVDVVEVYVPIMEGSTFTGAFEIYYDITEKRFELTGYINQITKSTLLISILLLCAVVWSFIQASKNIRAREEAEEELYLANENLETRVYDRTSELTKVNEILEKEIVIRRETEKENEQLITELRAALDHVKTLSGLLPICSSCQQIRDTEGQWSKVDEYIQNRTDAEFTHGICPTCAKKLYPDLYEDLEE